MADQVENSGDDDCIDCEEVAVGAEAWPNSECPQSKRECGHHCNHVWTHDSCCWCKIEFGEDGAVLSPAVESPA